MHVPSCLFVSISAPGDVIRDISILASLFVPLRKILERCPLQAFPTRIRPPLHFNQSLLAPISATTISDFCTCSFEFRIGIFPLWTNHYESWMTDVMDIYYLKDSVDLETCFHSRT